MELKDITLIQIVLEYLGVPLSQAHRAICEHEFCLLQHAVVSPAFQCL